MVIESTKQSATNKGKIDQQGYSTGGVREVVDVVWAGGTMAPRSVDGSIYTYRAGEVVTNDRITDNELLDEHGLEEVDWKGAEKGLGYIYKSAKSDLSSSESGKWNTGPLVPQLIESLNQRKEGRASVHHVCGITPYYMISEGDPDPATEAQFNDSAAEIQRRLNLVIPVGKPETSPNDRAENPKLAFIDVGYLRKAKDVEETIQVDHGVLRGAVPAAKVAHEGPDEDDLLGRAAGHGTFVGSVAATVAWQAEFRFERALTVKDAVVDERTVCEQLLDAVEAKCDVINLSLGCYGKGNQPPLLLERTLEHVLTENPELIVVAAAGNDGTRRAFWPAAFATHGFPDDKVSLRERIVSVGALDGATTVQWANNGPSVGWFAPGTRVVGQYIGSELEPRRRQNVNDDNTVEFYGHAIWEGSSHAAPYVSGLIARQMLTTGEKSAASAWTKLKKLPQAKRRTISLLKADEV